MGGTEILTQLLTALGPMGFVFWLVWRTTSHTIPRLARSFETGIEKQRQDFKEILTNYRESERAHHEEEVERLCTSIDNLAKSMVSPQETTTQLVSALGELKRIIKNGND